MIRRTIVEEQGGLGRIRGSSTTGKKKKLRTDE
jgi:hypothetical protein